MNDQNLKVRKGLIFCVLTFAIFAALGLTPPAAHAASSTVTILPNNSSYSVGATITVNGTVSPAPAVNGTNVAVIILSPSGATADANQFTINPTTGAYSGTFVTGGPTYSTQGQYKITANYNGATQSATVQYGNATQTTSRAANGTTISSVTTIVTSIVTTITQGGTTTTVLNNQQGTTVTSVVNSITTIVSSITNGGSNGSTALAVGAVGVIIAVIAGVLAVMAMRKK